jgi:hypothetical protein
VVPRIRLFRQSGFDNHVSDFRCKVVRLSSPAMAVRAGTKPPQLKTENGKQSMKALAVRVDPGDSTLIT